MPKKTMKVVVVEPNKPAYIKEIDSGYKSMQTIVGGLLEPIHFLRESGVVMVGNEEAKLRNMDALSAYGGKRCNRRFPEGIVAGTFLIYGNNGDDFCSLSDELCEKYVRQFSEPEQITRQEVEDDMKIEISFF